MLVVVSYDVSVVTPQGRRRLRQVARLCEDHGQRVQNSVFECLISQDQWVPFRSRLLDIFDPDADSLRFYLLGRNWRRRVEHHGAKPGLDLEEPLIT